MHDRYRHIVHARQEADQLAVIEAGDGHLGSVGVKAAVATIDRARKDDVGGAAAEPHCQMGIGASL